MTLTPPRHGGSEQDGIHCCVPLLIRRRRYFPCLVAVISRAVCRNSSSSDNIQYEHRLVRCHLLFASLVPSICHPPSNRLSPPQPFGFDRNRVFQFLTSLWACSARQRRRWWRFDGRPSFTRPLSHNSHVFHYTHFYIESFNLPLPLCDAAAAARSRWLLPPTQFSSSPLLKGCFKFECLCKLRHHWACIPTGTAFKDTFSALGLTVGRIYGWWKKVSNWKDFFRFISI